jgi:hypothetical protein
MSGPFGYIGSTEASRILKVSTTTLRLMVKRGDLRLAFTTPGGAARFDVRDVVALAEELSAA